MFRIQGFNAGNGLNLEMKGSKALSHVHTGSGATTQRNAIQRTAPHGDMRCLAVCKHMLICAKYIQENG